jgi:hypothetical protein
MRNPIYIRKIESPDYGVSTRGDFEPIVDEATFYRAQAVKAIQQKLDRLDEVSRNFASWNRCLRAA